MGREVLEMVGEDGSEMFFEMVRDDLWIGRLIVVIILVAKLIETPLKFLGKKYF